MQKRDYGFLGFISFLLVYTLVFYQDLIFHPNTYIFRDMPSILLPLQGTVKNLLKDNFLPLWNPYAVLGKPLFADPLSGLQYPPNWLLFNFNQPYIYNLSLVFHHFMAALGFYLFLVLLKIEKPAACFGAIIFSFSGALVSQDNMLNTLQSSSWIPWVLRYFFLSSQDFKIKNISLLAIFLSLTLLGGLPEILIFLNIIFLGLFIFWRKKSAFKAIIYGNLLTILISSYFLIPFLEYIWNSSRSNGLLSKDVFRFSLQPLNLFGFLFPWKILDAEGKFIPAQSIFSGFHQELPWSLSIYIGLSLLFTIPAILKAPKKSLIICLSFLILFTSFSFGEYFPYSDAIVEKFSLLASIRYPEKVLIIISAILALTSAYGFGVFINFIKSKKINYKILTTSFILLAAFDLYQHNTNLLPLIDWAEYKEPPEVLKKLQSLHKSSLPIRIYVNSFEDDQKQSQYKLLDLKKNILADSISGFYGITNLNSPASVNLAAHEKIISKISGSDKQAIMNILKRYGVNYVLSYRQLENYPDLNFIEQVQDIYIYKVEDSLGKFYFSSDGLEEELHPDISTYKAGLIDLEVKIPNAGYFILNDSYYPGWKVVVDDQNFKLVENFDEVMGIKLSTGKHHLKFYFLPTSLIVGSVISLLSLLFLVSNPRFLI